jgi:isoamylase
MGVDLIAEPWAVGDGTFQFGGFPNGWAEWNGKFRDSLRTSQNKLGVATVLPAELATRFAGSCDLFQWNSRKPGAGKAMVSRSRYRRLDGDSG